jgi:hypothetical protein
MEEMPLDLSNKAQLAKIFAVTEDASACSDVELLSPQTRALLGRLQRGMLQQQLPHVSAGKPMSPSLLSLLE